MHELFLNVDALSFLCVRNPLLLIIDQNCRKSIAQKNIGIVFDKHLCFHLCQAILIQFSLIILTSIKPLLKMLSLRYFQEWQLYRVRPLNRIRSPTLTIYIIDNTLYNNLKVVSRLSNLRSYYHDRCLSPISAVLSILCFRCIISVSFFYNEFIFSFFCL